MGLLDAWRFTSALALATVGAAYLIVLPVTTVTVTLILLWPSFHGLTTAVIPKRSGHVVRVHRLYVINALTCRVAEVPVFIAFAGIVRARVAAAHGDDDIRVLDHPQESHSE
jgi:hypothetical protein